MSDEDQKRAILTHAIASTSALSAHLDEDSSEYILSILLDDPKDDDAREAFKAFLQCTIDDDDAFMDVCEQFFNALDDALEDGGHGGIHSSNGATSSDQVNNELPRLLDNAITLKSKDIQTFASGLVAEFDLSQPDFVGDDDDDNDENGGRSSQQPQSDIQSFYANMIDVSDNPRATSERERRKSRQKEMREKMEAEERKRAIDDAVRMMEEEEKVGGSGSKEVSEEEMTTAVDNAADVHFTNFLLANRKGGGPDLLTDACLTLAGGRRYGLMGR